MQGYVFLAGKDIKSVNLNVIAGMPIPLRYSTRDSVKHLKDRFGDDVVIPVKSSTAKMLVANVDELGLSGEIAKLKKDIEEQETVYEGQIMELQTKLSDCQEKRVVNDLLIKNLREQNETLGRKLQAKK